MASDIFVPNRSKLNLLRYLGKQAKTTLTNAKSFLTFSKANPNNSEIDIINSFSSDTLYRLRFDDMQYQFISTSIERLLGYSVEEFAKINFKSLIVKARIIKDNEIFYLDSLENLDSERLSGKINKWQVDYLLSTKDNRLIWVSDISYPWLDQNGKVIGSVGCLRDIDERVRAEQSANEELIKLANTDTLTALANRRYFFNHLDIELKRSARSQRDVSMLVIDIDHFKKINDTYGHYVGDIVINKVAEIIKACLRESDLAARLGGEEFGVFLPDTPLQGAYWVAERICQQIAQHEFKINEHLEPLKCTVSIGVSCSTIYEKTSTTDLYKLADSKLYAAKTSGRNQVAADIQVMFQ